MCLVHHRRQEALKATRKEKGRNSRDAGLTAEGIMKVLVMAEGVALDCILGSHKTHCEVLSKNHAQGTPLTHQF